MCEMCRRNSLRPPAPSRRAFILGAAAAALLSGEAVAAKEANKQKKPPPKPQNVLSPDAALERLRQGNARYVGGLSQRHDFKHEREALAKGQNPYAAILSCADSRIAPEYAFDSARGDLFVCRVAGNFATNETIASLEYAVAVLGAPLILVLGHDSCGAVEAVIESLKDGTTLPGQMPSFVTGIAPAVKAVQQQGGDTLGKAIRQNVIDNVAKLSSANPILSAALDDKKLRVIGGVYRLGDGRIDLIA